MIRIFGDNGLPVFQAGHWLWQRPHSVQVEKSSMAFQEKSSTLPTPTIGSSASIRLSMSGVLPSRPSALGSRLVMTLIGARKMCRCLE